MKVEERSRKIYKKLKSKLKRYVSKNPSTGNGEQILRKNRTGKIRHIITDKRRRENYIRKMRQGVRRSTWKNDKEGQILQVKIYQKQVLRGKNTVNIKRKGKKCNGQLQRKKIVIKLKRKKNGKHDEQEELQKK